MDERKIGTNKWNFRSNCDWNVFDYIIIKRDDLGFCLLWASKNWKFLHLSCY
jgi:hypothetical protein